MGKTISFFIAVAVVIIFAFMFLNERSTVVVPGSFDNAQKADRCAEFKSTIDDDKDLSLLGYGGRVKQLLRGCF
jgi:hypothetical protein